MTTKPLGPILEKMLGPATFGSFMIAARTLNDLTQAEMARKLGISRGSLCDMERGRQLVSVALAIKLAKKTGFPTDLAIEACLQDQLNKAKVKMRVKLVA